MENVCRIMGLETLGDVPAGESKMDLTMSCTAGAGLTKQDGGSAGRKKQRTVIGLGVLYNGTGTGVVADLPDAREVRNDPESTGTPEELLILEDFPENLDQKMEKKISRLTSRLAKFENRSG